MKFIYFGTSEFAVAPLKAIASSVILVVSQPDRPTGRGMKLTPSPVKQEAIRLGIPVVTPEKCRDPEFVASIESFEADALIVASYGQIMPLRLLQAAKQGGINLHGSILPKYRGAAPIQRAIEAGEAETGVTLMQMEKGMDTGDIIDIVRTPIGEHETYGELTARLSDLAANQISDWAERLAAGNYPRTPQNHELATYAAKIERIESEIAWDASVGMADRKIRALLPSPGAFFTTRFGRLKLHQVHPIKWEGDEPSGSVLKLNPLTVRMDSSESLAMELHLIQPEGKPKMSGTDFANGVRLKPRDVLT